MIKRKTFCYLLFTYDDTDFFDIFTGFLKWDALVPSLFIVWVDYILQTSKDLMKENAFTSKMARNRCYSAETIMCADYADDVTLLVNTFAHFESLLHWLKQATRRIGLYMNKE